MNLLVALLISTNVGSCLKSLDENGFTLNKLKQILLESDFLSRSENYFTLAGLFIIPIFPHIGFWLEIMATTRCSKAFITLLQIINLACLLTFPIAFSFYAQSNYAIGAYFILFGTV